MELICMIILFIYVGFPIILLFGLMLWEIRYELLLFLIIFILWVVYKTIKKMINDRYNHLGNKWIFYSRIWNYCRFNHLYRLSSKADYMLLDELASNNKFGLTSKKFKRIVKSIVFFSDVYDYCESEYKKEAMVRGKILYNKYMSLDVSNSEEVYKVLGQTFDMSSLVVYELINMYIDAMEEEKIKILEEKRIKDNQKLIESKIKDNQKLLERKNKEESIIQNDINLSKIIGKDRYDNNLFNKLYDKLIDFNNIDEKKREVAFEVKSFKITEFSNFNLEVRCYCTENIKILGKSAIIDGSFKIKVLDRNDNLVAEGIINGNLDKFKIKGFTNRTINVLCKCVDFSKISKRRKYKFVFEPICLWTMEL